MNMRQRIANACPPLINVMRISAIGAMFIWLASSMSSLAIAQQAGIAADAQFPAFAPGMIDHMQAMRRFTDPDQSVQQAPPIIPRFQIDDNPAGAVATFQPAGATFPANDAFFQNLGTNGRSLFQLPSAAERLERQRGRRRGALRGSGDGTDPIFRLVDGAICPSADVSTLAAKRRAYALLINKGLIRIGLPMPSPTQFEVTAVDDPYCCTTNPVTGLTSPTTGIVSIYRRPLPSTNLGFLSTIMWDGREPSLTSQAKDATLGHAQAESESGADRRAARRDRRVRERYLHRPGDRQHRRGVAPRRRPGRAGGAVAAAVLHRRQRSARKESDRCAIHVRTSSTSTGRG